MRLLDITGPALQEFKDTWDYIARDNPTAASRLLQELYDTCETLLQQPYLGELRNDLQPGLRAFCKRKYVIFYRFDDHRVSIIRVVHGARDLSQLFKEDDE